MNLHENILRVKELMGFICETEEQEILHIPSFKMFKSNWGVLQKFLERRGNPPYSIGGNLFLNPYKDKIESFGNLVSVEGSLYLTRSDDLISIGNLISVGGTLDIQGSKNLTSLGNLTSVGDSQTSLDIFASLNLAQCENLTDLGNITSISGGLNLPYCKSLTSLGGLTSVGDTTSFGGMFSIGGYLNLFKCENLTSLGNLTSVGGDLDLRNTPLSKKYSEEEIRNMVNVGGKIIM